MTNAKKRHPVQRCEQCEGPIVDGAANEFLWSARWGERPSHTRPLAVTVRHADCSKAPRERVLNLNELILDPGVGVEIHQQPEGNILVVTAIRDDRVFVVTIN